MAKANGGIYTYIGSTDNNGILNGKGILTYPSGNKVKGEFKNNQLQIGQDLATEHNKLGRVIDCTCLTQEQFNQHIDSLVEATKFQDVGTIAIKHHQLQLDKNTADKIANHLKDKNITLQWMSCGGGDNNIADNIEVFRNKGITVVAADNGQSAITAKHGDAEYMVGVDESGNLAVPEVNQNKPDFHIDHKDKKADITYADSSKYYGRCQNGQPHGYGNMEYADGRKYEGDWFEGKMYGYGTMEYPSNSMGILGYVNKLLEQ